MGAERHSIAINLIPLQDIEKIMKQAAANTSLNTLTIKEKAEYIVSLFQNFAIQEGLILKLRKKAK